MLVLDENLPVTQQQLLRRWRIRFRVIGLDVARYGTEDENLIPALLRLARPTFLSLDCDFFRSDWAHRDYCLAWLDVSPNEAARFIRHFLAHPAFDTHAKRMGTVNRVHLKSIRCWRIGKPGCQTIAWPAA